MNDEIKVNSENTPPRKNLATLGQVKDALDKRDEKISSLKEDIGDIQKDKNIGENLYDKSKNTNGKYIASNGIVTESETLFITELIPIIPNQNYCFSMVSSLGGYFCVSKYDNNRNFVENDNIKPEAFTVDKNAKRKYIIKQYDCAYIAVSSVIAYYADNLMIAKGSNFSYEDYLWYWNDDTRKKMLEIKELLDNQKAVDFEKYELPYIKSGKLCCNGIGKTAYYAGVNCGSKITALWCNFIFEEERENLGNATLIINPNGVDSISNITDISLHCQIFPNRVKMDVLGQKFGEDKHYYQTLLNFNFDTPLICDGVTEHTAILSIVESSNNVYLTLDGSQYSAHFTPDSNITSISDVIGQYVIIEHFCTTDRAKTTMPMFTYLQARDVNNVYKLRDYFDRQNGVLQNAPTGQPYHLINNERYKK